MQANANKLGLTGAAAASFGVPFLVVSYLGMNEGGAAGISEGGAGIPIWAEIGILGWWAVLVLALAGRPALRRADPLARVAIGTLGAFAVWTVISMFFSDSAGRTAIEAARVLTYLVALLLTVMLWRPGSGRRVLAGVASAIAIVGLVGLTSRLFPGLFGPNDLATEVVGIESRLAFPVEYWNGLASLIAVGMPLFLWGAASARTQLVRSLAAAIAPLMILVIYLTYSRGGALAAGLGAATLFAFYPVRIALVPTLLTSGLGGLALIWAADRRADFTGGLDSGAAGDQGLEMLVICLLVAGLSAVAHFGIGRLIRDAWIWFPRVGRRQAALATGALVLVLGVGAVAAGVPSSAADSFEEFRTQADPGRDAERFSSASGNGRWQYWSAAARAGAGEPATGIGPGTFEFYWEEHGILPGYIVDAHSLYMEVFAELGVIGLGLLVAFTMLVLLAGSLRSLAAGDTQRAMLAGATGACAAFFLGAAVDWLWELPAIPIAALICAGVVLSERVGEEDKALLPSMRPLERTPLKRALGLAGLSLIALALIVPPYMSERARLDSQALREAEDFDAALAAAERAERWQPFAGAPRLQQALVYENLTDYESQIEAAREAVDRERTNWQTWYILARGLSYNDETEPALRAFARARKLNRFSVLLAEPLIESEKASLAADREKRKP